MTLTHFLLLTGDSCGRCQSGWLLFNTSCYFHSKSASDTLKNWHDSRADCIRRGGDLAVINNLEEQVSPVSCWWKIGLGRYAYRAIQNYRDTWVSIWYVLWFLSVAIVQILQFDITNYCDFWNWYDIVFSTFVLFCLFFSTLQCFLSILCMLTFWIKGKNNNIYMKKMIQALNSRFKKS